MKEKKRTYEEEKKMLEFLGESYRLAGRRSALMETEDCVGENRRIYDNDVRMIHHIDRCLQDCTKSAQLIIRMEFLEKSEKSWWQDTYSETTFYRLKKRAVEEFMHCLDI